VSDRVGATPGASAADTLDAVSEAVEGAAGAPLGESDASVIRSSTVMATGTIVSRITGVLRTTALTAAVGTGLLADAYNTANTLPNIIYILLIGGALNAVFIPQLVRHMTDDSDGGRSYADRLLTLSGLVLLAITVLAVLTAPWLTPLYAGNSWTPQQIEVLTQFAYLCLPQIFFYGMYSLYSQVLNTRGHFAAPMFAPIVNNIVVIVGCLAFLLVEHAPTIATISSGGILLLGSATTLGVVAQAAVLVPVMSRAGYRFRPRFDLRGQGLGKAVTLAKWTIFFVAVNQVAFLVVTRLANTAGAEQNALGTAAPKGSFVYASAHLMFVLPHSIITVSVVTALMPRMSRAAHAGNLAAVRHDIARGMRLIAAALVPATILLALLAPQLSQLLLGYGNAGDAGARAIGQVVQVFAVGLVAYSLYYVLLRGFFAVEDTRTPALVNLFLTAVNLSVGYALYRVLPPAQKVEGLAFGYAAAYIATTVVFWLILRRRFGGLDTYLTVRTLVRLAVAGVLAAAAGAGVLALLGSHTGSGKAAALVDCALVGPVVLGVFAAVARRTRVTEVVEVTEMVRRRLRRAAP
jgi:putative peptidoglycan lipid II flippase